jgi:hypothetical protein
MGLIRGIDYQEQTGHAWLKDQGRPIIQTPDNLLANPIHIKDAAIDQLPPEDPNGRSKRYWL